MLVGLQWGSCVSEGDPLLIHVNILLNCVYKYTDIYDGIDVLALKGDSCVYDGGLLCTHLLKNCVQKYMDIYDCIGMLACNGIMVLQREGLLYTHL